MEQLHENNDLMYNTSENKGDSFSYEAVRCEYDHCIQRFERLDNKIYIALTICAFLFVLIVDIIKKIEVFSFPQTSIQLLLIIIYSILTTVDLGLFTYSLLTLTILLKSANLLRIEPFIVFEKDLPNETSICCVKYLCSKYIQCIEENNMLLEKNFMKYNKCIKCLIPIVFSSFLLVFISELYKLL